MRKWFRRHWRRWQRQLALLPYVGQRIWIRNGKLIVFPREMGKRWK